MVGSRSTVYQSEDGLEIEVNEQYDVLQRRVLFDEVMLVTIHREKGGLFLLTTGTIAGTFFGLAILILVINFKAWPAALIFAAMGLPAFIPLVLRLILGVDVVTVFGKRSKAALRFAFRKRRAREVYGILCAAARRAQSVATRSATQPEQQTPEEVAGGGEQEQSQPEHER